MSRTDKLISNFLLELHSKPAQGLFEQLGVLLDHLEEKGDPDPDELLMVNSIYQALEHVKTLEEFLNKRVSENPELASGTKLQNLYDKAPTNVGSQILFD